MKEPTADEWMKAAEAVGINSPGGMQQAQHMARFACEALGLKYDETSPADIKEAIDFLKLSIEAREKSWRDNEKSILRLLNRIRRWAKNYADATGDYSLSKMVEK